MNARGCLFVISAPSGAGKSTLIARLTSALEGLAFSVSWTTRAPRAGEQDGVDYHFTDERTFRARIDRGEFLEWAEVHGSLYGTARAETAAALATGADLILDIDVQGAAQVRRSGLPAVSVFILPPSYDTLAARLSLRATESAATLARRLEDATREASLYGEFDYVVVNDELESAAADLIAIVRAARRRRERCVAEAARIVATFPPLPGR
jgi:guanylate kinase